MSSGPKHGITIKEGEFLQFVEYLIGPGLSLAIAKTLVAPLERLRLTYQVHTKK